MWVNTAKQRTNYIILTWRGRGGGGGWRHRQDGVRRVSGVGRGGGLAGLQGRGHGVPGVRSLRDAGAGDGSSGGREAAVGFHAAGVGRVLEQAALGR